MAAVPNYGLDADAATDLIERAFSVSAATISDLAIRISLSGDAETALMEAQCYPDFATIEAFLDLFALSHVFAPNDVLTAYLTILDRVARDPAIRSVEVKSFEDFDSVPALPADLGPAALLQETRRGLASVALGKHLGGCETFLCAWPEPLGAEAVVSVHATDFTHGVGVDEPTQPMTVVETVPILHNLRGLIDSDCASRLWSDRASAYEVYLAIALSGLNARRLAGRSTLPADLTPFSLGSQFLASLQRHQCIGVQPYAAAVLDILGQIVGGTLNRSISKFGRPRQVVRAFDRAPAYRVQLTKRHQALRLMLWQTELGLEFANVEPKHHLQIEDGLEGVVTQSDLSCLA